MILNFTLGPIGMHILCAKSDDEVHQQFDHYNSDAKKFRTSVIDFIREKGDAILLVLSHENGSFKVVNLSENLTTKDKEDLAGKDYEILKQKYDPMLV